MYKKDIEPHIINLFIFGGWHSGPSSSFRCSKTYILFWQLVMLVKNVSIFHPLLNSMNYFDIISKG